MKLIMENWKRYLVEAEEAGKAESDPTLKEIFIEASRLVVINKEGVLGKQRLTTFYEVSSVSSKKITFPSGETRDAFARKLVPRAGLGGWARPHRDKVMKTLHQFLRRSNRVVCRREGCTWLAEMFTGAWMNNYVLASPPEPDGSFYLFLHEPETQPSQSGPAAAWRDRKADSIDW